VNARLIEHVLYSGLGGPGTVFVSLVEADIQKQYSYRAVFCGIEPILEEYEQSCQRLLVPYTYVEKKKGVDLKVYGKLYKQFKVSKPAILFLHGVSLILPALWYRFFRRGRKIIVRDTQAHHLKSKLEWVWLFLCVVFANRIVVLTPEAATGIKKRFGLFLNAKKLVVIPNGLDMRRYCPLSNVSADTTISIGMQSRLQPIKDHATLLRAFKILKEELPGYSFSLHIAGDGSTRESIEQLIDELGIRNSVTMYGMLNSSALVSFMQPLDIYVHATFGETLSNSIMQSMACGLPTVASDVWGVNNMIQPGKNGLLYESGNSTQLAAILKKLVLDKNERQRLSVAARDFAEQHYSDSAMFNSYKKVFDELIK
jgi:L-malate glycosyltransferase